MLQRSEQISYISTTFVGNHVSNATNIDDDKEILYVEDDGDMLDIVSEFMRFEDYEVITDNGKTIQKKLKQHEIGLILLDENLTWGWGSDLCRELKADNETASIPVVLISALKDVDAIAEECGANAYIRKPFDIYDVIDVINLHYRSQ